MSINLNLPHNIEEIKNALKQNDRDLGLTKASNITCYIKGVCDLSEALKKDGRLDPGIVKELDKIEGLSAFVALELVAATKTE